jgi:hypothetical protein
MTTLSAKTAFVSFVALSLAGLAASPAIASSTSNKWRIEVSEGANSHGYIVFMVAPEGGELIEVRVEIDNGTGENKVARKIRDAFERALPDDRFHVEVDDGEDVLVKKKGQGKNFNLTMVSSSVKSVRIDIEKE